jgi:hypothetical protein
LGWLRLGGSMRWDLVGDGAVTVQLVVVPVMGRF